MYGQHFNGLDNKGNFFTASVYSESVNINLSVSFILHWNDRKVMGTGWRLKITLLETLDMTL